MSAFYPGFIAARQKRAESGTRRARRKFLFSFALDDARSGSEGLEADPLVVGSIPTRGAIETIT